MKLLAPFKLLRAADAPLDAFDAEVARLEAARAAADVEALLLESLRPDVLLTGSNDELRQHDEAAGRCRREVEQATARLDALARERDAREHLDADQRDAAERQARHEAGVKAQAEERRLLRAYEPAATKLADILRGIATARQTMDRANADLPEDAKRLESAEPNNGRDAVPDQPIGLVEMWFSPDGHNLGASRPNGVVGAVKRMVRGYRGGTIPGTGRPAVPHVPLLSRVALPRSTDLGDGFHWQGTETKPKPLTADELAILRYHGLRT